jgi:hypothetical protein
MGEWWAAAVAAAGEQPPADLPAAASGLPCGLSSGFPFARRVLPLRPRGAGLDGPVCYVARLGAVPCVLP